MRKILTEQVGELFNQAEVILNGTEDPVEASLKIQQAYDLLAKFPRNLRPEKDFRDAKDIYQLKILDMGSKLLEKDIELSQKYLSFID